MNNQEEPIIQIIVDEIADNQDKKSIMHVIKKKLRGVQKQPATIQPNGQRQAFDGKQQFGDKQICRICNKITTQISMIMCNRCHFRYHKLCLPELQVMEGSKWQCERCKKKIELLKIKAANPRKRVRIAKVSEETPSQQQLNAQELKQKTNDFLLLYPTYKNQGQIQLPIIDEYLIAYEDLFSCESKKKPQIKDDQEIPPQYFESILHIWDAYNNYDKIVSDLLYIEDDEEKCQSSIVGTFIHFRDNHQPYSQKTRKQIYDMIKTDPNELIMFFVYFYTKQLIEDIDIEQMSKQSYNPFWNIMGFLWYNNRNQYYELLKESASNIIIYLQKQDLLNSDCIYESESSNKEDQYIALLLTLINGLFDLKKTQQLVTFRIENLISNNKIKIQLANQVKELRVLQLDFKEKLSGWYKECENLKAQKIQNQLSKAELIKQGKELEHISKQLQLNKKEEETVAKKLSQLQERYTQLEEELHLVHVPNLMLNPSMFLGQDLKNSLYYFFLHEKDKIFVQWKSSWIDDKMKWGYLLIKRVSYYSMEDVLQLIKSLNVKGVKESHLKTNLEEILKQKLLLDQPENNLVGIHKINREGDSTEKEDYIQGLLPIKRKFQDISIVSLANLFSEIENTLTTFLNEKNCRWCSPTLRNNFKKSYENQNQKSLQKAVEFFLENTQLQEKIELRKEGEIVENQPYIDLDEDSLQFIPRKRKVVEDETSDNENFKYLEQIDSNKLKVRRVPMRLFGAYFENLRQNVLDLIKDESCDLLQIKTCLIVLKYVIRDYIRRKKQEQQKLLSKEKKAIFIEPEALITELQIKTQKKEEVIDVDNDWEETCKICGLGGKVLLCDSCPRVFHPRCLKLKEIPKGKWSCMICQSYFSRQVKTRQTLKKLQSQ